MCIRDSFPDPLVVFKGLTSKEREEKGKEKGRRREDEGRKGEVKGLAGPMSKCFLHAWDAYNYCSSQKRPIIITADYISYV